MDVGSGLYMYDVVLKRSRSLSHLRMSSCFTHTISPVCAAVTAYCRVDVNVALNRPAFQSSTYGNSVGIYGANRANDGNRDPDFGSGSCMSTWAGANPWYAVDLGVELYVSGIKFTNRDLPCCRTYVGLFTDMKEQEASTYKSAKTYTGTVFVSRDLAARGDTSAMRPFVKIL